MNRCLLLAPLLAASAFASPVPGVAQPERSLALTLTILGSPPQLGEPVTVRFRLENLGHQPLALRDPSVGAGDLRLYVADDGLTFREYVGPGWGLGPFGRRQDLEAGEAYQTEATVLFNHPPPGLEASELYARAARLSRIDRELAFPAAGTYWLRARLLDGKASVESAPVELSVVAPSGQDAAAWQALEGDGEAFYLLHTGTLRLARGSEAAVALTAKVWELAELHPRSRLAGLVATRLESYERSCSTARSPR
jgi:hypothetical protein